MPPSDLGKRGVASSMERWGCDGRDVKSLSQGSPLPTHCRRTVREYSVLNRHLPLGNDSG